MTNIVARKVLLPVVNQEGPISGRELEDLIEDYATLDAGKSLNNLQQARADQRGEVLDYQRILLQMLRRPMNGQAMDFREIEQIGPIVEKVKAAKIGDVVYLTEEEFKYVSQKVRLPFVAVYNELFHQFVNDILHSTTVNMEEAQVQQPASEVA